jgi:4-amino-4-deoxy-L-arabinose transferase-like glycosyltransferase
MKWLLLVLLVKALILGGLTWLGIIGLSPDEAQYWTWSQALDWGYYSKPPGIAWQIALTTALVGNTALGVRIGALFMGSLISLAVYGVARAAELDKRTAIWAGVIMAVCPLGFYLTLATTTDGGAILCLTLAVIAVIRGPNYWLAGLCILIGALFKWTAFIFWPVLLPFLFFSKQIRKLSFLGGLALSLLSLLPSLYWNMGHEWATFKHVGTAVKEVKGGNFFDFLAAQIGLLSPVFFILLVWSYFFSKKRALWIAAAFPAVVLIYLGFAFFKKMQPNWAAFLYPPGMVLIAWVCCEKLKKGKVWLYVGTAISLTIVAGAFAPLPYRYSPLRQTLGWDRLSGVLDDAGYNPQKDFLFSNKYQNVSLLSFYGPEQKRAYYFNVSQTRKNQFSYWPQMHEKEIGKTGYFVVLENMHSSDVSWYIHHYQTLLTPYFEKVTIQGVYPLYESYGVPVKYAVIFKGIHYLGLAPQDPEKY